MRVRSILRREAKRCAMLGLGIIFKALLLVVNAMAILHEERFLKKGKARQNTRRIHLGGFLCYLFLHLIVVGYVAYVNNEMKCGRK